MTTKKMHGVPFRPEIILVHLEFHKKKPFYRYTNLPKNFLYLIPISII